MTTLPTPRQLASEIVAAWREAVRTDANIEACFLARVECIIERDREMAARSGEPT